MAEGATRCGFVAVLGAPNAGKSTFVNQAVGTKVSTVTHKVQTTRFRVLGICMRGASQIIFIDTPGIFAPKRRLDRSMVSAAWRGALESDRVVLMIDAQNDRIGEDDPIVDGLKTRNRSAILLLNKIDQVDKARLLDLAERLNRIRRADGQPLFSETFMISALSGDGVDHVLERLTVDIPEGPWMFPEDQVSDLPERMLAADLTREKIMLRLHQEIPYKITVETENWNERKDGSVRIEQVIYVTREAYKKILLGKKGQVIKAIGSAARTELEELLGCKVHLFLFVKVRNWEDDPARYGHWGLEFDV